MSRKRKYSEEFRAEAVKRMETCDNVSALARELGIRRKFLYQWRSLARTNGSCEPRARRACDAENERLRKRVDELERLTGRQAAELDFFKGALRRIEARRQQKSTPGAAASMSKSHGCTRKAD